MIVNLVFAAATMLDCQYNFMGAPTAGVRMSVDANGKPGISAEITMSGRTHKETVTPAELQDGQFAHVWLSKENPNNAIEMIVYRQPQANGNSVLINHNVPINKEMWGECAGVPAN